MGLSRDKEYIPKRVEFSEEEFEEVMNLLVKSRLYNSSEVSIGEWFNRMFSEYRKIKKSIDNRMYYV